VSMALTETMARYRRNNNLYSYRLIWHKAYRHFRSKIKVTQHQSRSQKSLSARYLKNYLTNFNQTWQSHTIGNTHNVTTTWMQKVKGQGHLRLKIDLEPGGGITELSRCSVLVLCGRLSCLPIECW